MQVAVYGSFPFCLGHVGQWWGKQDKLLGREPVQRAVQLSGRVKPHCRPRAPSPDVHCTPPEPQKQFCVDQHPGEKPFSGWCLHRHHLQQAQCWEGVGLPACLPSFHLCSARVCWNPAASFSAFLLVTGWPYRSLSASNARRDSPYSSVSPCINQTVAGTSVK